MPKVPVYDTQQVQERPLSSVRNSAPQDTSLQQLGNALSGIGAVADRRAQEAQEDDDAAQLTEVLAGASDKLRPVLYEDILTRQGKDAFSAYQDTDKSLADIAKEAESSLRTDKQRDAFRKMWAQQRSGSLGQVSRHVASQRQAYRQNMAEVGAKSALEDAAAAWSNPEESAVAMQRGTAMIRANLQGQAPEVITEKVQAFESNVHAAKIDRMAIANPMVAKAYYLENKDKIDGLTQGKIEKLLDSEVLRVESQAKADSIVAGGGGIQAQLEKARAIADPKLRDETVSRVKSRYTEAKQIQAQFKADLIEEAGKIIVNGGSMDDLRPQHREALGPSGMASLKKYSSSNGEVTTNLGTYYKLQDMATNDPKAFEKVPLIQYAGDLEKSDMDRLSTLQRSIKKGDSKDLILGRTLKQIQDAALRGIGLKPTDEKASLFRRRMEETMKAEGIDKEDKDWREKAQAVADRLMIDGEVKGGFFGDPDKRLFQVNEGEQFFLDSASRVPDGEQAKIKAALQRAGIKPTDEAILQLYQWKNGIQ